MSLRRNAWNRGILALVLVLEWAATGQAGVMYAVTDMGWTGQNQMEYRNLFGTDFLGVNVDGRVGSIDGFHSDPGLYDGPVVPGMGRLVAAPHFSPDGLYAAGTAFAEPTSQAAWGGFLAHRGEAVALGGFPVPGGGPGFSTAFGVNNLGEVVGEFGPTSGPAQSHAFVRSADGSIVDLGSPNGGYTAAFGINNLGRIVGLMTSPSNTFHAFVSDGQTLTDLNGLVSPSAGYLIASATGINDNGQIAAYGIDGSGAYHNLLLTPDSSSPTGPPSDPDPTPVPEPATAVLLGLMAAAAGCRSWRRERPGRGLAQR